MGETVEKKLYNAASKGDLPTILQLLQQDPYLVEGVSFSCSRNLLHIATMFGQLGIVEEVLKINPQLALILDSEKLSPLHIAAAKGHFDIVKKLISVAPEMCWWRNDQGMNPVHVAAMNGHVEVLELLLEEGPFPAMERLYRGETVLHLCVKHGQLGSLKVLVEKLEDLVDAGDDDGETLLHMAVRSNQLEIMRYVVERKGRERRRRNSTGNTPLDILNKSAPDYLKFRELLLRFTLPPIGGKYWPKLPDMTMVVVILIATMEFQGAISPPGGVWQDNTSPHNAGEAVMASTHPNMYTLFVHNNAIAFGSSILVIVLITTGYALKYDVLMFVALYAMWVSLAAITVSYGASTMVITPNTETKSTLLIVLPVVVVAIGIYVFSFVFYLIYIWYQMWRRQKMSRP